jgi:hypothetical protein
MAKRGKSEHPGWAGQWDRHRWTVVQKSDDTPLPPVSRRLRSLDEFEVPGWMSPVTKSRLELSVTDILVLAMGLAIGAYIGLVLI